MDGNLRLASDDYFADADVDALGAVLRPFVARQRRQHRVMLAALLCALGVLTFVLLGAL